MSAEIVVSNAVKVFGSGASGVPALQDITATVPDPAGRVAARCCSSANSDSKVFTVCHCSIPDP